MSFDHPRVWVAVFLIKNGRILLGKRAGKHGEGEWWTPGGHLELWESPEDCAKREVLEETGIALDDVILGPYTNDLFKSEGKHYVTLFAIAECPEDEEPRNMEPEKCLGWEWFDWHDLPNPHGQWYDKLLSVGFDPVLYFD